MGRNDKQMSRYLVCDIEDQSVFSGVSMPLLACI